MMMMIQNLCTYTAENALLTHTSATTARCSATTTQAKRTLGMPTELPAPAKLLWRTAPGVFFQQDCIFSVPLATTFFTTVEATKR